MEQRKILVSRMYCYTSFRVYISAVMLLIQSSFSTNRELVNTLCLRDAVLVSPSRSHNSCLSHLVSVCTPRQPEVTASNNLELVLASPFHDELVTSICLHYLSSQIYLQTVNISRGLTQDNYYCNIQGGGGI